ncbi:MAG: hypothetical protein AAFO94_22580, partial [Bacteroidota bacterium]
DRCPAHQLPALGLNIEKTVKGFAKMFEPMMQEAGVPDIDQLVEQGASELGLNMTASQVYNMIKGDMVIAVNGLREFEKEVTTYEYDEDFNRTEVKKMKKEMLPGFTAMLSYSNENDLMPLIQMGIDAGVMAKEGNHYNLLIPNSPMDMYLIMNRGVMFITNDANMLNAKMLKKGLKKKNRIGKEHLAAITTQSQVMFWDISQTLDEFGGMAGAMGGSEGEMAVQMAKDNIKNMWLTAGKVRGGVMDSQLDLNMTKTNMNVLEQILEVADELFRQFGDTGQRM